MAKSDYIAQGNAPFSTQQATFANGIGSYSTVLGLTPADITGQAADAKYFAYVVEWQTVLQNSASQAVSWTTLVRDGGNLPPTGAPVGPALPTAVPAVAPGIEGRFRALVRRIKSHPAYNEAMGKALGIEGSEKSAADLNNLAPAITAAVIGSAVQIGWGWQGHGSELDLIEIHVNRGHGYALLTYDTTPGYTDTAPFPATPEKWTYKAIYRVGDSPVGQWSAETSVTVGG
ncbi:MAG: hypothetical protein ABIT37_06980 [Luteolibacter sp.]